jgi:cytidine deaminase
MMETPETISKGDTAKTVEVCSAHGITSNEFSELRERAVAAKATAYCPYSQFRVGATVLSSEGELTSGANVENAAYPVGTCAERVALGTAVTSGHRGFRAIAVATDIAPPASPCGMCRQL